MKNNCIGIAELLCAYADGELEESKKYIVEDHLIICENCSAILKVYSEISSAIDETNISAPEALRTGVMNRIRSEETHIEEKTKKHRPYFFALTRFAPIAACLLVGLLIWQPWGGNFRVSDSAEFPASAPMPQAANNSTAFSLTEDDFNEQLDLAEMPTVEPEMAWDAAGEFGLWDEDAKDEYYYGDVQRRGQSLAADDIDQIFDFINGAYAEIMLVGELPSFLANYEPLPFGSWFEWEMVFEIPSTEVQVLLDELGNSEGVIKMQNHDNAASTYAVVLFSHED